MRSLFIYIYFEDTTCSNRIKRAGEVCSEIGIQALGFSIWRLSLGSRGICEPWLCLFNDTSRNKE